MNCCLCVWVPCVNTWFCMGAALGGKPGRRKHGPKLSITQRGPGCQNSLPALARNEILKVRINRLPQATVFYSIFFYVEINLINLFDQFVRIQKNDTVILDINHLQEKEKNLFFKYLICY